MVRSDGAFRWVHSDGAFRWKRERLFWMWAGFLELRYGDLAAETLIQSK